MLRHERKFLNSCNKIGRIEHHGPGEMLYLSDISVLIAGFTRI